MRIVQLSDIHLSKENLVNLKDYYREALIRDLESFHKSVPIDVLLLTGDLVDKGGHSFGSDNPYEVFDKEIIVPIVKSLGLQRSHVYFVPGNHDIDRNAINEEYDFYLRSKLNKEMANQRLEQMRDQFDSNNSRIKKYKDFEKTFHAANPQYQYSNNESLVVVEKNGVRIGLALINDSWRCSSSLEKEQHFIGSKQLFNAKNYFQQQNINLNIAVFHHPLELVNSEEAEEIDNILESLDFSLAVFGHTHKCKLNTVVSASGGIVKLNGRAAFNNPTEGLSRFQPGYTIIDIDLPALRCTVHARKFIQHSGFRFDRDVDSLPDGTLTVGLQKKNYYPLHNEPHSEINDLPSGYSTDVDRIVRLLIGKSLYSSSSAFVRELIQNAVDACHRRKEVDTHLRPKITVNINTQQFYFEITDEGDGMTKRVLREHFAIIGKSISQEVNPSNGHPDLISQFGIGFISTFMVAEKVVVSTKSRSDERIEFEIDDVFKGFTYTQPVDESGSQMGTTIRVYLKKHLDVQNLFAEVVKYCRHVENLEVFVNGIQQVIRDSWNLENAVSTIHRSRNEYELRLAIGVTSRHLIASNSGFFIGENPAPLIPFRFPFIIGGEVNFKPRAIDFDLSRTNIIDSEKSRNFRKELSVAIKQLFRSAVDSMQPEMRRIIANYCLYYLSAWPNEHTKYQEEYEDFFTRNELINYCLDLLYFDYGHGFLSLREIIQLVNEKQHTTVYYYNKQNIKDYEQLIIEYLTANGNFLFIPTAVSVQFREATINFNPLLVILSILQEHGLLHKQINGIPLEAVSLPELPKDKINADLLLLIEKIEKANHVRIRLAPLKMSGRPVIQVGSQYIVNTEHPSLSTLLSGVEAFSNEAVYAYLLGLFRIDIQKYH